LELFENIKPLCGMILKHKKTSYADIIRNLFLNISLKILFIFIVDFKKSFIVQGLRLFAICFLAKISLHQIYKNSLFYINFIKPQQKSFSAFSAQNRNCMA